MKHGPVPEARLADTPQGRLPETDGWFIVNLNDVQGVPSGAGMSARSLPHRVAVGRDRFTVVEAIQTYL